MPAFSSPRHVLMLVAAAACWGCGTVLSKLALDRGVPPLTLLAIELTASCLLLLVAARLLSVSWSWSPTIAKLTLLGVLNPGLAYALGLWGLVTISASMSVLLWALEPVVIILLAVFVLRENISPATLVGLIAAIIGVLLVVYQPGAVGIARGVALTLAAVAACALYTVLTRRLLLDDSSVIVVLYQQVAALIFAVVIITVATTTRVTDLGLPADARTWALAAVSGMVYYGLAFWFFISGLRGVPASVAGLFLPLTPVFGLGAGYLIGDQLISRQWLGASLVVLATAAAAIHHLRQCATTQPEQSSS